MERNRGKRGREILVMSAGEYRLLQENISIYEKIVNRRNNFERTPVGVTIYLSIKDSKISSEIGKLMIVNGRKVINLL